MGYMSNFIHIALVIIISLISALSHASESCSRTATINYQEVLIDSANSLKGDGLRPYLSKDPQALQYLEIYQQNARPSFKSSFLGTTGVLLSLLSFTTNSENRAPWNSSVLLTTGITLIVVNFIFNIQLQSNNEENLYRAIDEYNLKNTPKIDFSPDEKADKIGPQYPSLSIGFSKDF